ncbi:cytochrome P450 67 [Cucurbitaria berberidis CBS 394.84]|uniref:Cytochrome P450 67 n=1 Tax=Cucurbitaria berberidis CBS 394.84 TaxID=1168544 RepID=A0A9P4GVW3_9PLEO|nr:cytochrome P450 67 [Cucurbitaria berberidis CBS 394.84]KAF1851981.1 cytochrome P450 67 [Cucurbitaria berberidis CBS 394.84]
MASITTFLSRCAQANTLQVLRTSAVIGVCFHIAIARASFEFEQYMFPFLALASVLHISEILLSVILSRQGIAGAILQASLFWIGFSIGFLTSLLIYRLFLHRCRKFPGPLVAKFTRFYAVYLNAKDAQFYQELGRLHDRYGDYLRVGPREVSILDAAAIPIIYGPNTKCIKATWYAANGLDADEVSIGGIRDPAKYRLRRRAWDRGLSIKGKLYLPRVKAQTDILLQQLMNRAGQPMDISEWAMFYSFDVMGDVGFGNPFTNMATGREDPAIYAMHKNIWPLGMILTIPWFPLLVGAIPGAKAGLSEFYGVCTKTLEDKQKMFESDKEPTNVVAWLLKAIEEKDVSASPTHESLAGDTQGVILAGSDTTANTLSNALFLLTKHPEKQQRLRELLHAAVPEGYNAWDYTKGKNVTYIDDIINETLRLKPPIIQGLPHETPAEGIQIGDKYIPGHVNVSVPGTLIQRDSRWWKQPNGFIPERWTEKREEMGTANGPWIPFQLGMHSCAGKNLAYLTLRIALSAIVQNFEIPFAPGETGEKFDGNYLSSLMMTLRPLKLVFTPISSS